MSVPIASQLAIQPSAPAAGRSLWLAIGLLITQLLWPFEALAAEKLRLQLRWLHQFQFAGYYMALEKGFYRQAGLDVQILPGGPQAARPIGALLAGEVDFAIANSGLVIARLRGKPVVALAAIMQTSPVVWIVRADSGIYTVHDLAGKRAMLLEPPESAELRITLLREGIDLDRLQISPTGFDPQDLVDGRTDAYDGYTSNEPYWLKQQGVDYRLINPREYGVNFYNDVLATREALLEQRPEQVEAFVNASLKGWQYALDNIEESILLIQQRYAPEKTLEHLRFEAEELKKLIMPELVQLGHMNPGRWQTIADSYVELGMAEDSSDLDGFLYQGMTQPDHRLLYQVIAGAALALLLMAIVALRFARLSRRLRREVSRRRQAEQELRDSNLLLERVANTDPLTGLWTRLKLEEVAHNEIKRAERYGLPLSLLFFDIDHFKVVNDQHGHDAGDRVLRAVAQRVQAQLRESDCLCRWGGEEFVILMPHTNLEHAAVIAEKLRILISNEPTAAQISVTASFGVAQWQPGQSLRELVKCADQVLYRAKQRGRNRIECYAPAVVPPPG
ncbi:diguanylate cyclase [Pseudomonas sp. LPB0260]|uniref:GGDEF domain-containing protein n=1 Tax=Pseudomonas sp. LPB0260 TaxID=2614442 RepID=UPI0015C2262A|nr:GGDEF domain-containing protein [Pseudomonas sp. LPB0260]QLC74229.1 diguanylate cyclase [Pseudomonas sp. LPB0260]QLC76999.1 diguanylate cyclase [Pseudomonas sp. LPB0260]